MKKSLVTPIALAAALTSSLAFSATETKVFDAKGLERLKLDNTSGDVKITLSTDGKAHVAATKVKFENGCKYEAKKSGDTLDVEVEKKRRFASGTCKVNLEIKVPKEIALRLRMGSGNLDVQGTKGEVDIRTGSGDAKFNVETAKLKGVVGSGSLKASGTVGVVDLRTGSGDIEVAGLTGDSYVTTGSGDVTLTYKTAPTKGRITLKSGSGDTTVYLPAATKLLTTVKSGSGKIYNEIGDSQDASFIISMKSGSGSLKVKKLP